jgi:tripartite-type tricarboxylate transporter receptor subunit TctC
MKRIVFAACAVFGVALAGGACAQAWPNKPIRLVVGYTPAGAGDVIARIVGDAISRQLGQTVTVDNKPGAGSTLASEIIARAPPDGYTLGLGTSTIYGVDQHLYKVKYKAADFTPITRLTVSPLILAINKDLGPKTVPELIAYMRANPGKLNYASSGIGGSPHLGGLALERMAGGRMVHVPFKGGAPALQSVASGDVQLSFGTAPSVLPMGQQGLVRMLAVSTAQRSAVAPELPTIAEAGLPGFDFTFWFGLFGPAGLPKDITDRVYAVTAKALADPQIKARLLIGGNEAAPSRSPAEFAESAVADGRLTLERVVQAGIKLE